MSDSETIVSIITDYTLSVELKKKEWSCRGTQKSRHVYTKHPNPDFPHCR